jgi:hypothetical protein
MACIDFSARFGFVVKESKALVGTHCFTVSYHVINDLSKEIFSKW